MRATELSISGSNGKGLPGQGIRAAQGAGPSHGSPGHAGTRAPPPGTAHAFHRGQPGCSGWQPPAGRERRVRGRQAQPPALPPSACALTAGCSGPSVCSRICRASWRRSVASLYLFWSLWGSAGMEGVGQGGVAEAGPIPAGSGTWLNQAWVTSFGGPFWVFPHLLSLTPSDHCQASGHPGIVPTLLGSLSSTLPDSPLPGLKWFPQISPPSHHHPPALSSTQQ